MVHFLSVFVAVLSTCIINYNSKTKFKGVNYFIVASVSLMFFFIVLHEGFSDLYFGFNALLLILMFLLDYESNNKIIKVGLIYGISLLLFFFLIRQDSAVDFSFKLLKNRVGVYFTQKDSAFYNKIIVLESIGEQMDQNTLMIIDSVGNKYFGIPAYMGVPIWNGCNSYSHSTINNYVVPKLF